MLLGSAPLGLLPMGAAPVVRPAPPVPTPFFAADSSVRGPILPIGPAQ